MFVRRSTKPEPDLAELRGDWRAEPGWPLERMHVDGAQRQSPPRARTRIEIRGDVGASAWISCAGRLPWGQPIDQREDDALSLVYEWQPLDAELEIMGHAELAATITSSVPVAYLSAKLCDVFPDGTSALVTRGVLNLAHRDSSTAPEPLAPGEPVAARVELDATSWVFEAGHRLRLSLAGADWPNVWPPPAAGTLTRGSGRARALVAGRRRRARDPGAARDSRRHRGRRRTGPDPTGEQPQLVWRIEHDVLGRERSAVVSHGSAYDGEEGARVEERYEGAVGVSTTDPGAAWARATSRYVIRWPEADCATEARLDLRSDADAYHVVIDVVAEELGEGDGVVGIGRRERRFERTIPRRLQ